MMHVDWGEVAGREGLLFCSTKTSPVSSRCGMKSAYRLLLSSPSTERTFWLPFPRHFKWVSQLCRLLVPRHQSPHTQHAPEHGPWPSASAMQESFDGTESRLGMAAWGLSAVSSRRLRHRAVWLAATRCWHWGYPASSEPGTSPAFPWPQS